ncbi:MAG: TerC family protein [Proteobacteria bacterium]|jgi:tellurite resistance protein TerC|nr:TerC family protein [Alphaproteobacteria bacterium]NCC03251.1 TerC family protein [Pseudomonadota bacterium]
MDFAFLTEEFMSKPIWMWFVFAFLILGLLILDLGVMHRKEHEVQFKESLILCTFYTSIALLFGGWIWYELGAGKFAEYLTGYIVEETLSIDNVFVIALLFSFFHIPRLYQHRVLFWGILGAIVMRGIMITVGAALVHQFEWVLHLFAAFLVLTGIKMLISSDKPADLGENAALKFIRNHFRITDGLRGNHFFVKEPSRKKGKKVWWMTPLFVCLIMIELADVVFAVDSVPAIFMITTDPFIVYTSNIFAIMGLRSLYFVLAAVIQRFHYLKYALSVVLIFIGSKSFIAYLAGWEKFPIALSLGITFGILGSGIAFSLWKTKKSARSVKTV